MLIHVGLKLKEELYKLIKQIWEDKSIPPTWKTGFICLIHKKGDKSECNNYKGITLLNSMYKIMTSLINMRIMQIAGDSLGEYQCGFHKGRSTMDQIFVLRQTIEKFHEYGKDLHILFIDYKKAFNNVRRSKLTETMHEMGIATKLINLTMMTLHETYAKVKLGNETVESSGIMVVITFKSLATLYGDL
jgi:sorting nexin-29